MSLHISTAKTPFAREEAYMADAMFSDEVSEWCVDLTIRPRGVRLPSWKEYELSDEPPIMKPMKKGWPPKMLSPTIATIEDGIKESTSSTTR